jgi:hypothetical protein
MRSSQTAAAVCVCAALLVLAGAAEAGERFEQTAFDDFVAKHWGPDLFTDECTGLLFDSAAPLVVFGSAPTFAVTMFDVAELVPIDVKSILLNEGDEAMDRLRDAGKAESFSRPVDITSVPFAKLAISATPKREWQVPDGYLLRFSNRIRYKDHVYLQLWVKASDSSSGTRIAYKFDQSGRLLRSRKYGRTCDDWG